MLSRILTPEEKQFEELLAKTWEIHRNSVRKNIEHRLAKAKAEDNQTLIAQLQAEFRDLHL